MVTRAYVRDLHINGRCDWRLDGAKTPDEHYLDEEDVYGYRAVGGVYSLRRRLAHPLLQLDASLRLVRRRLCHDGTCWFEKLYKLSTL